MSKAVLVMNMPENCYGCRYCNERQTYNPCCALTNHSGGYQSVTLEDIHSKRQSWCPLRPLPERKGYRGELDINFDYHELGEKVGWNACLDEITGGAE